MSSSSASGSVTSPSEVSTSGSATSGTSGAATCWSAPLTAPGPVAFTDVTTTSGIDEALTGMMVHAVAAGDVNADGYADLFVGSFGDRPVAEYALRGANGPAPDRLLLGSPDGFRPDQQFPEMRGRTAGAAFADLDKDGDLDLVISRNPRPKERSNAPSVVLRNDDGRFTQSAVLDTARGGRSIGVLDSDGDAMPDLVLTEDRWTGGSSVLFHNDGGLVFSDRTAAAGLPHDVHALGVSTVDLTGDRLPDLYFSDSNRLFINKGGTFTEEAAPEFDWPTYGDEDDIAGVTPADLDGDGRVDLVLGQHYNSTLDNGKRVPIRVYLNQGPADGRSVTFRDITSEAGVPDLPTKAPHVIVADLNSDSRLDILTTGASGDRPITLMNTSQRGHSPRFTPLAPVQPPGEQEYWVTGAILDADHDGRREVFLAEWFPQRSSLLLEQSGGSGHWLTISAGSEVGTLVTAYDAGHAGEADHVIGHQELTAASGFGAGTELLAHFGLGAATTTDVVVMPPGGPARTVRNLPADSFLSLDGHC